jgi:hypothetical protein
VTGDIFRYRVAKVTVWFVGPKMMVSPLSSSVVLALETPGWH